MVLVVSSRWPTSSDACGEARPDFSIGLPIAVGVACGLLVIAAINATGSLQTQLRGGDEQTFLSYAHVLASTPWGHGFFPHGPTSCRRSCSRSNSSSAI